MSAVIGAGDIQLVPISETAWRLCDARVAQTDADHLIAYVEIGRQGDYEVVWIRGPRRRSRVASLEQCTALAALLLAEEQPPGRLRPVPISHFPPARSV